MSRRAVCGALCSVRRVPFALKYGARWQSTLERKWSTPLAKTLTETITTTGPVSIASYMRQCLTSDLGGYYTRKQEDGVDQFGKTGDFVTSPEISQIFGELVGLWLYIEWIQQRQTGLKRPGTDLIELGPGRGTLMSDILRTISRMASMNVENIYLVEASQALREVQAKLLCTEEPIKAHEHGFVGRCKYIPGADIIWVEDASFLPPEPANARFIVAHEFFDALPIHAFTSVASKPSAPKRTVQDPTPAAAQQHDQPKPGYQWHELLVNPTAPPSPFDPPQKDASEPRPEFELVLSSAPTRHSKLLPGISPRYRALLTTEGSTIEVSPESRSVASLLARLIGPLSNAGQTPSPAGAALIIDYGTADTIPTNTLRGIRRHATVSPFSSPGAVDLSADVDFSGLVEAALEGSDDVEAHGPVSQGDFLHVLGGRERLEALMQRADGDETREALRRGWERLTSLGPDGMGKVYKALAIVPYTGGKRRPVGFGGSVEG